MQPEIVRWIKIVVLKTVRDHNLFAVEFDELLSAGYLGYVQALRRFQPQLGYKLKTFAEFRIKGAVLDEARCLIGDERAKTPRPTQDHDYDIDWKEDPGEGVDETIDVQMFLATLPVSEKSREILRLRSEGWSMKQIGKRLGCSESRVSQIMGGLKQQVRNHLVAQRRSYSGAAS